MKNAKQSAALIATVFVASVAVIAIAFVAIYALNKTGKIAEGVVENDSQKMGNERLNLMAQFNIPEHIDKPGKREPVSFELS